MNEIQTKLAELQDNGWTLAAIADELGLTVSAVEKWKAGTRHPANPKPVIMSLNVLSQRKRIPKQRRYAPGSRQRSPRQESASS